MICELPSLYFNARARPGDNCQMAAHNCGGGGRRAAAHLVPLSVTQSSKNGGGGKGRPEENCTLEYNIHQAHRDGEAVSQDIITHNILKHYLSIFSNIVNPGSYNKYGFLRSWKKESTAIVFFTYYFTKLKRQRMT